jgi:ClpP class serine protease
MNSDSPLSSDARAYVQSQVDQTASYFRKFVAKARGVTVDAVRSEFGDGRMLLAQQAKKVGLVDRVETFDAVLQRVAGRPRSKMMSAEAEELAPVADEVPALSAATVEETAVGDDAGYQADVDGLDVSLALLR